MLCINLPHDASFVQACEDARDLEQSKCQKRPSGSLVMAVLRELCEHDVWTAYSNLHLRQAKMPAVKRSVTPSSVRAQR